MLAVLKKELKTYFLTPLAYIFLAVFIFVFNSTFYIMIFDTKQVIFENVIIFTLFFMSFLTPVLTMRMFAEEKNSGTDVLLFTSPRSIFGIVLGKLLAAGIIIVISILISLIYYLILVAFGAKPSLTVTLVALLGFFLIEMAYISFGMFASSVSPNQFIAAVIPIGFAFLTIYFNMSTGILSTISLIDLYRKFPLGIISLRRSFRSNIIYNIISSFNCNNSTKKKKY